MHNSAFAQALPCSVFFFYVTLQAPSQVARSLMCPPLLLSAWASLLCSPRAHYCARSMACISVFLSYTYCSLCHISGNPLQTERVLYASSSPLSTCLSWCLHLVGAPPTLAALRSYRLSHQTHWVAWLTEVWCGQGLQNIPRLQLFFPKTLHSVVQVFEINWVNCRQ